jgi:PAS domain S-box-containing protein
VEVAAAPRRSTVGVLTALGFGFAILAGAVVGLGSYRSILRLERDIAARYQTHLTLMSLGRLLTHLVDAETGQRGFIITGDSSYLEPYQAALGAIDDDTTSLRRAARTDTALGAALARLAPLIGARFAIFDTTIRMRRAGVTPRVLALVQSGRGKRLMDSIRVELSAISDAAEQRRDARTAEVRASVRATKTVIFAGGAMTVVCLGAAGVAISRQLRARARAEQAVREREHQLFQMLEAMPVGVFVVNNDGRPYYANQSSKELLGKGIEGVEADVNQLTAVYQAYRAGTDQVYPGPEQPIVRALAGEKAHATDIEIHRPDRVVPLEVWAAPVVDDDGRVRFGIAAFGDVTEREQARRQIEELGIELEQQVEELQITNRELETFSYSVSHDLRAPLRAIDGFSRILLEDYGAALDPEAQRLLGIVRSNTQRMGRLIDDLLTFSRYGRQELHLTAVDMGALARSTLDDLRQADGNGSAQVTMGPLPTVRGDPSLLRQVWANLLGNAIKYSRRATDPRVEVHARAKDGTIEFLVKDNGVGFDMAYAGKLFGVFQRLHRDDEFEGTGVGLATVQRIVHRHGGRVWAEARPGEGATFFFTLPVGA